MAHRRQTDFDAESDRPTSVHSAFERQAARTPERVAVVSGGRSVTYAELNRRANRLARFLRSAGVGPEVFTAVCLERSVELSVALLAVQKAGGAYLPLDPASPAARLERMLRDSGAPVMLIRGAGGKRLSAAGVRRIDPRAESAAISRLEAFDLGVGVAAESPLYAIYTSGSTGDPRGVVLSQRAVIHRLTAGGVPYRLEASDGVLQGAAPSFDFSVWELFAPLLAGARVVMPEAERARDPAYLAQLIAAAGVSVAHFVPPLLRAFLDERSLESCDRLRLVLSGGEALSADLRDRCLARLPARLVNQYGPTEACIDATSWHCRRGDRRSPVPIGRPLAGVRIHLLDERLRAAGAGEPGELHIAGPGLARGYLGRPRETAARFVPDPFAVRPGDRLYRTGDLARRFPDGNLAFLGRLDDQVKVRGVRIELGEVEAALLDHPSVRLAAVVARRDPGDTRALVAYAEPEPGRAPSPQELRRHLADLLPQSMLPAAVVVLERLPLSPGGKVDRRALPAPGAARPELDVPWIAPSTAVEVELASLFAELLGVDRVGIRDSFFELGGHSLMATRLLSAVRDGFRVELPLDRFFARPTVERLAAVIAEQGGQDAPSPAFERIERPPRLPLSFAQERVWFVDQLEPANAAYQFQAGLRFRGPLDEAALERALGVLVRRHESLRTTFPAVAGRPAQEVHPPWNVALPVVELGALPEEDREAEARRRLREFLRYRFRLDRLPLIRWVLFRWGDRERLLLHLEHHLIHDGWSFNVLLRELFASYAALSAGRPAELPELDVQFADFVLWQRRWMESAEARRQLDFWRRQLAGCPRALALPTDRPRPPQPSFRGGSARTTLPESLYAALRRLGRSRGATLFMVMTAAFAVLLRRLSGETDVAVGSGIANRRFRETERLVGMLVNNVVLRADFRGDPTAAELLDRIRRVTLAAYANQDLPFERVVKAVRPERDLSHNPLFQVMFSFHDSALPVLALPGTEVELVDAISNRSAKFDMNVIVVPRSEQRLGLGAPARQDGMIVIWEYASDLFDAATVERMLERYRLLLGAMLEGPSRRTSELPLLTLRERRQLLAEWRAARSFRRPGPGTLDARFAASASRRPEALAVSFGGAHLSYGELDRRANRLAHHLRSAGVAAETLVALCLERSPDLVVAILAVLKAGGAYLPLDPDSPPRRLAHILADARAPVALAGARTRRRLPAGLRTLCLDADRERIRRSPSTAPAPASDGAATDGAGLAYVIYTSGSTGRPKGVMVEHRQVGRLFDATDAGFGFGESDVWTLFHSYAFDFSVWEIWGALLFGGRLVVLSYDLSRSPGEVFRLLVREKVTVLNQTPSAFYQLIRADEELGGPGDRPALREVIFGGEALDLPSLAPWLARHGDRRPRLVNMYGITETTVHVSCRPLGVDDLGRPGPSPIGGPIPDLRLCTLDERLAPVPPGVSGELCVGGAGVARGYLGRPALTARRFVPDPFSPAAGERLYRSGDGGRRREGGEVEYLGRLDRQVKVRGFRIELGEIENALACHPRIRECVVLAREDRPGDRRLVAYAVAEGVPAPGAGELRRSLAERLPDYMIPAAFLFLDSLPLTEHGKVDRRSLPVPGSERPRLEREYEAPRTRVEKELAAVWREVLGVAAVGVHDDYFALGGDSILSVRIVALARARGLRFTIQDLFRHQKLAALAAHLDGGGSSEPPGQGPMSLVPAEDRRRLPAGVEDAYPLSALQMGILFHSEYSPGAATYHVVRSLHLRARFDYGAFCATLDLLARRHPVLRTDLDLVRYREPLQLVRRSVRIPLAVCDLRRLPLPRQEEAIDAFLEAEKTRPFDLTRAPLTRFHVLLRSAETIELSVAEHHVMLDGWSVATLLTELFEVYSALLRGAPPPLAPPPGVSHRDYVALERQASASPEQRSFWRRRVGDGELRPLARPATAGRRVLTHQVALGRELARALAELARRAEVPLKTVLLAAHLKAQSQISGEPEVVTGLVTHGRPEREGSDRILGLFLNTLPLRHRIAAGSWLDLLRRTLEAESELMPFRRFPLSEIQALAGGRKLFDTAFNFNHFHVYERLGRLGNLEVLDRRFFQETDFTLIANFRLQAGGGRLRLGLDYDAAVLSEARVVSLGRLYTSVLESMAREPAEPHQDLAAGGPWNVEGPAAGQGRDRPALRLRRPRLETEYAPPEDESERAVAETWADVLGVERVGRRDSFFELGGDSLKAARIIWRLRDGFGVELPIRALFERPSVAELAAEIGRVRRSGAAPQAPAVTPVRRRTAAGGSSVLPASFAQRRLWLLDQLEPGSASYNVPRAVSLLGPVDRGLLGRVLADLVARHESLRTTFAAVDGEPRQVIAACGPADVPWIDLSRAPEDERRRALDRLIVAEAARPFDLSRGPLLRLTGVALGERHLVLILVVHHIVCDARSLEVLFREMSALYGAHVEGRRPRLGKLAVQYADFAVWQRRWLTGEVLEAQLDFWRRELAGVPAVLELATDRPRPRTSSAAGRRVSARLAGDLREDVETLSRRRGSTAFMTLLAAFQLLLHRYTGQAALLAGTPVTNRNRGEVEGVIGFFVNLLPVRSDLAGATTVRDVLASVRRRVLAALAHQDLPFERLVESLNLERRLTTPALVQALFVLQPETTEALDLPGVEVRRLEADTGATNFDLTLSAVASTAELATVLRYRSDLFDPTTAGRMLGHYRTLLAGMAADPDRNAASLPLLTAAERAQQLDEEDGSRADYPLHLTIPRRFAEQAARTPDAIAVVAAQRRLSYGILDRRSSRLAHRLRRLGVGPERFVGLVDERAPETVTSLFAVLKAGGAYLPLDPQAPPERLRSMLEDAGAALVIASTRAALPAATGVRGLCLDEEERRLSGESASDPAVALRPENAAYAIFTSGSTGRPKGVVIRHRGVVNLLAHLAREVYRGSAPGLRVAVNAALSFDVSVKQILQVLSGHQVHLLDAEVRLDPPALAAELCRREIDAVDFTPSHLAVVASADGSIPGAGRPARLLVAGEAIGEPQWRKLRGSRRAEPWNLYGPTEYTVLATARRIDATAERPTLGRPLANTRVHLLDGHGQPVPAGVPGEMFLAGDGLARGYLRRPAMTAASFLPDPRSGAPGARLYRSGDRGRRLGNGEIDFLGRLDDQVKVRGVRVEPREVAAVLNEHEAVRDSVVRVRRDETGDLYLAAWARLAGEAPDRREVLRFLRRRLPEAMVPRSLVFLDAWPLNASGKVDRDALPAAGPPGAAAVPVVAPRNAMEAALEEIWCRVLGCEPGGVHADFFASGGHSLKAAQMVSRVRDRLALELPLRQLFETPTIAGLAAALGGPVRPSVTAEGIALTAGPRGPGDLDRLLRRLEDLPAEGVEARLGPTQLRTET